MSETKVCSQCGVEKPRTEYYRDKRLKDGLLAACKSCKNERNKAWRVENPDRFSDLNAAWSKRNRQSRRDSSLKYKYGLVQSDIDLMLRGQGGCGICHCTEASRWVVDHDHSCCSGFKSCGECVRAVLCHSCNVALGHFREDPEVLRSALRYLEEHSAVFASSSAG